MQELTLYVKQRACQGRSAVQYDCTAWEALTCSTMVPSGRRCATSVGMPVSSSSWEGMTNVDLAVSGERGRGRGTKSNLECLVRLLVACNPLNLRAGYSSVCNS